MSWGLEEESLTAPPANVRRVPKVEPPARFLHYGMLEDVPADVPHSTLRYVLNHWCCLCLSLDMCCHCVVPHGPNPVSIHSKRLELVAEEIDGWQVYAAAVMELLPPMGQLHAPPPAEPGSGWLLGTPWRLPKHPTQGAWSLLLG